MARAADHLYAEDSMNSSSGRRKGRSDGRRRYIGNGRLHYTQTPNSLCAARENEKRKKGFIALTDRPPPRRRPRKAAA